MKASWQAALDPERLLDSIVDDALATGLARLNAFLPIGVSIDLTPVDLTPIRNGDAASSDGWRFRGRGRFQLTGRENYRAFSEWHEETSGEGINFEADPDRAAEPVYAVRSGLFFWLDHDLPELANAGLTEAATDCDLEEQGNRS